MNFPQNKKPNFFIVGAPKAGTTALYHYLKQHPNVYFPKLKEPNYFSYDAIKKQKLYYKTQNARSEEEYVKLYEGLGDEKMIGEASVSYLFYESVAQKIHAFNSDAIIVILLRDPVQRAYSHYLMDYNLGYIDLDFDEVIYQTTKLPNAHLYYQQYVELGFYKQQVERYLQLFGSRVKIYLTNEFKHNKYQVLSDICNTMGIKVIDFSQLSIHNNRYKKARFSLARKLYGSHALKTMVKRLTGSKFNDAIKDMFFDTAADKPLIKESTAEYLKQLYKPNILETEELLERRLDHWYQ